MTDEYRIEMQPPDQFRYNNAVPPYVVQQPIGSSEQIHKSKNYDNEVRVIVIFQIDGIQINLLIAIAKLLKCIDT